MMRDDCHAWHERSYEVGGFGSQRRYPNEEFVRFVGRNFGEMPIENRGEVKFLEIGCGSGANLWMAAKEGFNVHGIDFSLGACQLAEMLKSKWGCDYRVEVGDMRKLNYPNEYFDVVYDVFSAYCLDDEEFDKCLDEVKRVLKRGGKFFSYTPSKKSDVFKRSKPADRVDNSTLDGIRFEGSPFFGNMYPFRFISIEEYIGRMKERGMEVPYMESVGRTYFRGKEYFEFIVMEAAKP